jgi:hypothetical protein
MPTKFGFTCAHGGGLHLGDIFGGVLRRFTCATEAVSTPPKMIAIHNASIQLGCSTPKINETTITHNGLDAFIIWINATDRYKYARLEKARLPPKHIAIGTKRSPMSRQLIDGTVAKPSRFHTLAQRVTNVMCISTSVSGKAKPRDERMYLLYRMMADEKKIHCAIR